MDRALPLTPSLPASSAELANQSSRTALDALESAIAAAHADGDLASVATQTKERADAVVRAAESMKAQVSALEALARITALVETAKKS
jgi:hypothetical protein